MTELPKVTIYTDGGCDPNPGVGGWAAVLIFGDHEKPISGGSPDSTNNKMELTAACEALEALDMPHKVDLYTDSQYVMKGITEWMPGWKRKNWRDVKNVDLWQRLDEAVRRHKISWHWVKGHAGIEYNERVDQMAMQEITRIVSNSRKEGAGDGTSTMDADVTVYLVVDMGELRFGLGGWGAVIIEADLQRELSGSQDRVSHQRLSLIAALEIIKTVPTSTSIRIFTNSEYLEKGMNMWIKSWIKRNWMNSDDEPIANKEIWQKLYALSGERRIFWTRASRDTNDIHYLQAFALGQKARKSY